MAITIIRDGKIRAATAKGVCGDCGCEFTFGKEDTSLGDTSGAMRAIHCPCCGWSSSVDEKVFARKGISFSAE